MHGKYAGFIFARSKAFFLLLQSVGLSLSICLWIRESLRMHYPSH